MYRCIVLRCHNFIGLIGTGSGLERKIRKETTFRQGCGSVFIFANPDPAIRIRIQL